MVQPPPKPKPRVKKVKLRETVASAPSFDFNLGSEIETVQRNDGADGSYGQGSFIRIELESRQSNKDAKDFIEMKEAEVVSQGTQGSVRVSHVSNKGFKTEEQPN